MADGSIVLVRSAHPLTSEEIDALDAFRRWLTCSASCGHREWCDLMGCLDEGGDDDDV